MLDDEDDDGADAPKPYQINEDGVAILALNGPMTKRPTSMSYYFGGTSTVLMRRAVRQAAADPDVRAIALIVDSPGGQVKGTADLADDVAAARKKKPVGAYAEDTCCSAAYWVASQADFLHCNSTAAVGSIGTLLVIQDTSGAYAEEKVKVIVVSTGPFKGAGADGSVITDEQIADFQREVDDINACFLSGVAAGRALPIGDVEKLATGQVHIGQKAVDLGLCDAVTTIDGFLRSMGVQAKAFTPADDSEDDSGGPPAGPPPLPSASVPPPEAQAHREAAPEADASRADDPTDNDSRTAGTPLTESDEPIISAAPRGSQETETMPDETTVPATLATVPATPATPSARVSAANTDILTACQAAGITNGKELAERFEMARFGDRYSAEVREDAKVQAVRAHGAELGQQLHTSCEAMPIDLVIAMRDGWKAEADKKFDIAADGSAPARKSAPARVSVSAETGAEAKTAETKWDRLSAEQKKTGTQMGMTTPEKREAFAAQYLGSDETAA